jgi:hypothetical protein
MRFPLTLFLLILPISAFADAVSIPISNQGWNISLDAPTFARRQGQEQGPTYIYRANSGRFNLSIFVEPQAKDGGSKECYEFYWPRASRNPLINKPTIKVSNTDKFYRVEYDIAAEPVGQRNVNYYFMFDGKWVDVHISLTNPTKDDDALIGKFDKGLNYGKTAVRAYALQEHGTFQLKVPESWKDSVGQPGGGLPPTITFAPKAGAPFKILVTALWSPKPDSKMPSADELKATVRRTADGAAQQAVEKTIGVKPLKGSAHIGYYFAATDRAPKPGEFKFLNQGMVAVEDFLVTFTILTNEGQDAVVTAALSMLSEAEKQ